MFNADRLLKLNKDEAVGYRKFADAAIEFHQKLAHEIGVEPKININQYNDVTSVTLMSKKVDVTIRCYMVDSDMKYRDDNIEVFINNHKPFYQKHIAINRLSNMQGFIDMLRDYID